MWARDSFGCAYPLHPTISYAHSLIFVCTHPHMMEVLCGRTENADTHREISAKVCGKACEGNRPRCATPVLQRGGWKRPQQPCLCVEATYTCRGSSALQKPALEQKPCIPTARFEPIWHNCNQLAARTERAHAYPTPFCEHNT